MKIIILEDEIPAYKKLVTFLKKHSQDIELLAWHRSIEEGMNQSFLFKECDLILADIELLDGVSFELFSQIEFKAPIIFCTAYNQYLQDAFKTNGIAYISKPYSEIELKEAISKYQLLFEQSTKYHSNESITHVIETILKKNIQSFKQRYTIKKKDGIILKQVHEIVYFQANGDFCFLYDSTGQKHHIKHRISDIEKQVDPNLFFRINRSEIVNISYIKKISTYFKNKVQIHLTTHSTLMTSQSRTTKFRIWLEGT